jgi:LmbE family N-acetylglucosaminyl deacetylase
MATVLVIHAHPDDEVFATAGWMVRAAAAGDRVVNIVATGGEASEMRAGLTDLETARALRLLRLENSLDVLGSAGWEWLDTRGRWIDGDRERHPTLADESLDVLALAVDRCITRHAPELVLTVGTDGLTGHPDHIKIGQAVSLAVSRAGRPDRGAWGAQFRAVDVDRAHALLKKSAGEAQIGSGRVVGTSAPLHPQTLDARSQRLRRRALDCYSPGLGTMPIERLVASYPARGDSLLLRGLLDVTGWATEYYSELGFGPA